MSGLESIAGMAGCVPQTLRTWVKQHEIDADVRDGVTTADARRIEDLERGVMVRPDQAGAGRSMPSVLTTRLRPSAFAR